jgi:hypothetical protein
MGTAGPHMYKAERCEAQDAIVEHVVGRHTRVLSTQALWFHDEPGS